MIGIILVSYESDRNIVPKFLLSVFRILDFVALMLQSFFETARTLFRYIFYDVACKLNV